MLMQDIKNLPYVKLHNFQALAAGIALWVVVMVLGIIPVVNCLTPILALIGWIYLIYIGVQGYNGKFVKIPVLYDFVQKQGWS